MDKFKKIYNDIINDEMNAKFNKLGYKPIFMANKDARVLIIGQAPGLKTQLKGVVFDDRSGDTLRSWLGVSRDIFYNSDLFAVLPLDFYFPGKATNADLPPRVEFADKWHPILLKMMPNIKITILIGAYAQKYYLKDTIKNNLTNTVLAYKDYLPRYFVLVHPSPLNFRWHNHNPSFKEEIVSQLRNIIHEIITN